MKKFRELLADSNDFYIPEVGPGFRCSLFHTSLLQILFYSVHMEVE